MPFYFRLGKRSQQYSVQNKTFLVVPIELLTNECVEITLFATSLGQECLEQVCQKTGIVQTEYFGLLFKSKNKNMDQWVDLGRPLKKQLDKYASEVRLYFRLQYFVPNFHFLSDEISRYHYFCAMKSMVIDGRIATSRDDAILLAGFSLQAEFGDYNPERHTVEYLNNFAFFPHSMVTSKIARDLLVECAINAYRNLQGVPTNVAEIYYISEAQQRDGYGQEGFPARDLDTGQDVCLGVCIRGIFVMNTDANTVELFKWSDISNLVHNKKVFVVEGNNYRKSYSTFDSDYASCIWRTVVEQHQYYIKGIQAVQNDADLTNDQATLANALHGLPSLHFLQNELFAGSNFLAKRIAFGAMDTNADYSQIRPVSLYETINNKSALSPSPQFNVGGQLESSSNVQEYNVNGFIDNNKKTDGSSFLIKKRSSTEPIDLHHITLNCAPNSNGGGAGGLHQMKPEMVTTAATSAAVSNAEARGLSNATSRLQQTKAASNASSPRANSVSNTPIYENQLNSSDLTYEQRKKLLPPYKSPPDYESFIKRKYSVMATLSQSMSSIPSRLASHNQINSASSSSSLVHPFVNTPSVAKNNISSSSTMSVPFLLQQQQQHQQHHQQQQQQRQQVFNSNMYKNYVDLSNLDIDKQSANVNSRGSLPPTDTNIGGVNNANRTSHPIVLNQLHRQKQQMQSSGMFTASSPELNNLSLFQKRTTVYGKENEPVIKSNGAIKHLDIGESNLKDRMHLPHCFTSVPDLTFQQGGQVNADRKMSIGSQPTSKGKSLLFNFTGKNLRIFRSQNNTGSVPNLMCNDLSGASSTNNNAGNCYNLPRAKRSIEHLNKLPQQRSNSITMLEHAQPRHLFSYSNKIDEAPELAAAAANSKQSNECISANGGAVSPNDASSAAIVNSQNNMYSPVQHAIYANLNSQPKQQGATHVGTFVSGQPATSTAAPAITTAHYGGQKAESVIGQPVLKGFSIYNNNGSKQSQQQETPPNGNSVAHNHHQAPSTGQLHPLPSQTSHHQPSRSISEANKQQETEKKNETMAKISESLASMPKSTGVPKNSRIIVFDRIFEDDQDFTRDFELLPRMKPTAKFTTASLPENVLRNRFRDILPFEENRVKLTPTKDNKFGYINASHVVMKFGAMSQHYIAAQGPLPATTIDFWQMVFEHNINIIVMVTNFHEAQFQKCHIYFPLSNEPGKNTVRFGDYEIVCNYTTISLTYITSYLTLSHNGQKRDVTHLRYTDWNDHSIPGDLQGFLSFLSEMDAIYRRNTREGSGFGKKRSTAQPPSPILVHCSAGAGRSGVVILTDALLKCLDHNFNEPIDIPRALIQLRFQRMISVQHCEQFRFVCQVLSQYLSNSRLI